MADRRQCESEDLRESHRGRHGYRYCLLPRTVSEAPRPHDRDGWTETVGMAAVVSIRRDEGSLSEVGTKSLWVLNQRWLGERASGQVSRVQLLRSMLVPRVSCDGEQARFRPENAGIGGQRASALKNWDSGSARVATACGSVGGSATNWLQHFRPHKLPAENGV
jgi:hypothetical protein